MPARGRMPCRIISLIRDRPKGIRSMKLQVEKPDKQVMRFFTPELYRLFNSADDEEANRADELWEQAIQEYQKHLDSLRDRLPTPVRKLSDLNFHDAEILGGEEQHQSTLFGPEKYWSVPAWTMTWILTLRQGEIIHTLIYSLWDEVREYSGEADWPFSKSRRHWLYDELDVHPDRFGMFLHRILWSDGSILEIPFAGILTSSVSLARKSVTIP